MKDKSRRRLKILIVIVFVIITSLLVLVYQFGGPMGAMVMGKPVYLFKPSPYKYGKDAITIIENLGYYAEGDQWIKTRDESLKNIKDAKNYAEAREEILKTLEVAGGKHSTIWDDELREEIESGYVAPEISVEETERGEVLVLKLPPFMSDEGMAQDYANSLIQGIESHPEVIGYVVDLRENTGGDMGPMVAGLSPLIPDGEVLAFRSKSGDSPVVLENGVISGGGSSVQVKNLAKIEKPVAVLQSGNTGSSGEATLLSFKGLGYSRFFGTPSAGYASANMTIPLYDGALMLITVAADVDRTGQEYMEDPILPDVETEDAMGEALQWIQSQM